MNRFFQIRPLAVLFILLAYATVYAQGWERTFGSTASDVASDLLPTADGGWLLVGTTQSFGNGNRDVYLVKVDADGFEQWHRSFGNSDWDELGAAIAQAADGGFYIAGTQLRTSAPDSSLAFLIKTDVQGNQLWTALAQQDSVVCRSLETSADGNLIITGSKINFIDDNGTPLPGNDFFVWKAAAGDGSTIWEKVLGGAGIDEGYDAAALSDGSYLVVGYTHSFTSSIDALVYKLDVGGNVVWEEIYGAPTDEEQALSIIATSPDEFVFCGFKNGAGTAEDDIWLTKIDTEGDVIFEKTLQENGLENSRTIAQAPDGNLLLAGNTRINANADRNVLLWKTDSEGNLIWKQTFGGQNRDEASAVLADTDGNITVAGFTQSFGNGSADAYLIRTNSLGQSFSNILKGNVFQDLNDDCIYQTNEPIINGWFLNIKGTKSYYATTDLAGNFNIAVDTGTYTVSLLQPNEYWEPCQNQLTVSLQNSYDTLTINFPVQKTSDCSSLHVDVSTPFLRRCFSNTYFVQYCNQGTQAAAGSVLEIELDPLLDVTGASLPWTNQSGNVFTFDVGNLEPFECGNFKIFTTVNCDSAALGQTHCVEAHIYPDSFCIAPGANWDGASVDVDAVCTNDSIKLFIRNVGDNEMNGRSAFIIIEDQIISKIGSVQLDSGQDTVFTIKGDGKTIRLEVDQRPGHPGRSNPSVTVEGCGSILFSTGYVTQFPQDDGNTFVEIDCQENIGSYDPNDKRGDPKGFGQEHFIEPNTDLEYHVRFQNTGTDTAFTVVIRDTLSSFLDKGSVIPGASSHPYTMELYGDGVLKFTFNNILLPDSTTNEQGSHGFVKFRIRQMQDVPLGTLIENGAAIYFDFNAPVITNFTDHLVGLDFVEIDTTSSSIQITGDTGASVVVFPNPFSNTTLIKLENYIAKDGVLKVYNAFGRLKREEKINHNQLIFNRKNLPNGLYFFEISDNNRRLITGKLLLN